MLAGPVLLAVEPAIRAAMPETTAPANEAPGGTQASLAPAGSGENAGRSWFNRLFTSPENSERQRAAEQIETMGFGLDAGSFTRAVLAQNARLVSLYLHSGFDLNARGEHGRSALLSAALAKLWPSVDQLLKAGANANSPDENGVTPLMAAAMADHVPTLQLLLQGGAQAAAADSQGHTALHYAVAARHRAAIDALIAAGAPVTGHCCAGHDLLTHAFDSGEKEIILPVLEAQKTSLEWNPPARSCLVETIASRDADFTRLLLAKFPAAPTPEGKAQPLLAWAMIENDLEKFKYLLECGADPNTALGAPIDKDFVATVTSPFAKSYLEGDTGMNTLMLASGLSRLDYVKALIDKGAKRFVTTNKYKMIPLYFAAHAEMPEIMQLLIGDCPSPEQMRIEISLASQRLNLMKDGVSVFSAPVSTGRPGFATPAGRYVITDKHLVHVSTIYKTASMPFFMRLNCRDFGMHEGQLPGYPASHGCIRLPGSAARQLFKDVPIGTLVSISR